MTTAFRVRRRLCGRTWAVGIVTALVAVATLETPATAQPAGGGSAAQPAVDSWAGKWRSGSSAGAPTTRSYRPGRARRPRRRHGPEAPT